MEEESLDGDTDDDTLDDIDDSNFMIFVPPLIADCVGRLSADIVTYPLQTILHRLLLQGTGIPVRNSDLGM